ncbi:uncharacterized protein A1O5_12441 [Cladophialophora psammophila CBS 110553]|uniref:BHLH domain-containing protein n=1 Tax=Cladophialophora psammophila CBS 110553 TaxID=1182543 RepID=W9VZG8_9EURO|nr:uncharacterized protein A1O5_12441 [Cladophialophora psammophila CBS 110553]EXJ57651.1 hypothetical protein A1O5_12441 [Cladophialophora psammophila CBS 110553]
MDSVDRQKRGPSRAITVEKAVDYIIALQQEVDRLRKESSTAAQDVRVLFDRNSSSNNTTSS